MFISQEEVINIVFNRNVDESILKPVQIKLAQDMWVRENVGDDFYNELINNNTGYTDFISDYIKPIVAYGTLYSNFESITTNLTDKGLILLLSEGGAVIPREERVIGSMRELYFNLMRSVKMMKNEASRLKKNGDELFKLYDDKLSTNYINFSGPKRQKTILY